MYEGDTIMDSGGGGGVLVKSRTGSSTPGSPRSSVDQRPAPSPLRTALLSLTDGDEAIRIDKASYENMFQDIAGIKKMLLKLRQVLSEAEGENQENGGLVTTSSPSGTYDGTTASVDGPDEMTDLRRQVTFLQQQLEERERTVQCLQMEISKTAAASGGRVKAIGSSAEARERCNAATQTDRVRPISTGPSILQSLPSAESGNLVRWRPSTLIHELEPSHHFANCKPSPGGGGAPRSQPRPRTDGPVTSVRDDDRSAGRGFAPVKRSPHVDKIMEKVKELNFKPVEVIDREVEETDVARRNGHGNGVIYANGSDCKPCKNVFKITKIDLVLKSDNYGKSHHLTAATASNR